MGVGAWVVVVALVAATLFGAYRALTDGRFRGTHRVRDAAPPRTARTEQPTAGTEHLAAGTEQPTDGTVRPSAPPAPSEPSAASGPPAAGPGADAPDRLTASDLGTELGERATLLQFSSAFCAPCRATRHVLADVAATVPGVTHVEVDAESHLALVRRVGVQRTPTTLILDADGAEVSRAAGALRKPQVLHAVAAAVQP